jgi:hypothetical protein
MADNLTKPAKELIDRLGIARIEPGDTRERDLAYRLLTEVENQLNKET